MTHEMGMQEALQQARLAFNADEVPVGAALFRNGVCICADRNRMRERNDPTAHAEMLVLKTAGDAGVCLSECTLFVTLEPCAMCAGAMLHHRLGKLVYGAFDERCGCCGSVLDMTDRMFYHSIETWGGILEGPCHALLTGFFSQKRCNSD